MKPGEQRRAYWRRTLVVTAALLAIWFVATFGVAWFARDLDFAFFGWPFAFWMAAQGALVVYVAIVWFYARYMNGLDERCGIKEPDQT